jgi:PEP-CTERM putative exosortase interaction domain
MRKILTYSLVTAAAVAVQPAQAVVTICLTPNCVSTDENVLVTQATGVSTVYGTTQDSSVAVEFTSNELLNGEAAGQARVEANDGVLNSLTFALMGGYTFQTAVWNFQPLSGGNPLTLPSATSVLVTYFDPNANVYGNVVVNTNGQNYMGISGDAGEMFTAVSFLFPEGTGVNDLRQLRLGGVQAPIPEPATWAMMIVGLGFAGGLMRRRATKVQFA